MLANISNSFLFILFSMGILLEPVGARSECNSNVLGKNFVLGFPDNYALQEPNIQLHILLVSFNTEMTQVKLTGKFPFSNGSTFGKIVSLHPGEYERVIVPSEYEIIGTEKSLKTIEIESDYKISVYAIHLEAFTTDGYLAIPVENLGTQYVIATYQSTRTAFNTLFAILATTDNTVVTVLLSNEIIYNGTTYSQGDTLTLELKRYEAVQIQSATSSLDNDLTGSIVDSNNPIAVISGHQCANSVGSFCDVILEQSIPVNSWGTKHFYSNPPDDGDFSRFRMIAYFSNTVFTYNGTGITLGPGEVWEDDLYGNGIITTTQPALLVQILIRINGSVVDPSLIQVPSENQFTPFLGFTTPTHAGGNINGFINFVNIIVKTDERPTIRLNNQSIVTANNSLPSLVKETTISDSDYTLLIVELPRMEALYFITQVVDESSPMSAIVYGYERDETYGYAAGLSLPSSERFVTINPFNVRQLGGERLAISLPCESGVIFSDVSSVKCRVGINDEELLEGEFTDLYNVVNCFTLPTFQVGFITLYVSLDAGDNFPFTGLIYIADEETLLPQITIQHSDNIPIIDYTEGLEISLTWDPVLFVESRDDLMLDFLILSPSFAVPVWEFLSPLMPVVNSGTLSLTIESLLPIRRRRLIVDDNLTIGVIVLRQSSHIYITARLTIVSFSTELDPSICAAFEDILEEMPSGLDPCPCTEMGALADTNFQESSEFIDFFHEGSSICFRSATPSSTNSGQQCCYTDGIINLEIGAGTADTYSPNFNIALHFTYDVLPWFACCYLTNNCGYYSSARPADDCSAYEPPFVANTQGDPHFTTLDGLQYTFNGAGEFTLAISPLYNFTFQARMEIYLNTNASVYTAFAIQTHNSSKVQLQRNILNQTLIFIDNESFQLKDGILLKRIANGVTLTITEDFSQVNVQFNSGVSLRIYLFSESMSFLLQLIDIFKGNMEGLLGNFNGDTSDDLTSPDGSSILTNSTLSQIHYEFGLEWMISESDSIFSYQTPFDYNTYSIPSFLPSFISPDLEQVSSEVKELCGDSFPCLFDAVTTGVLSFANETLIFTNIVEEIMNNSVKTISCGFPGLVENGYFNGSVYFAGNVIRIQCYDGFALEGPEIISCSGDGIWSDSFPSCNSISNSVFITVAIIVAILLILLMISVIGIILSIIQYLRSSRR